MKRSVLLEGIKHGTRGTRYSREFKEQAIALADESEKPAGQIEAELGISRGRISRWRRELASSDGRHGPSDRDRYEFRRSMSRKGSWWDNAVMESFFATLKRELIAGRQYSTRQEAIAEIFEYIEVFYNRRRSHS